jgi:hypothetical protein
MALFLFWGTEGANSKSRRQNVIFIISSFINFPTTMEVYLREKTLHYAVDKILDHHYIEKFDCYFFKIQWHPQYHQAPTWEPLANLRCPNLLLTYTLKSENLLDPWASPTGVNKTVNGTYESTSGPETAHSRKLSENLSSSWRELKDGKTFDMFSLEASRLEIILLKMILKGITFTVVLFSEVRRLVDQSCIIWRFPSIGTELKGAITLHGEILSLALLDGEITIPRSAPRLERTLLPTRPVKRQKSMETNSSPKEQSEK